MTDKEKQQTRKDAALAIRVLCAAAGDLTEATQLLAEEVPAKDTEESGDD